MLVGLETHGGDALLVRSEVNDGTVELFNSEIELLDDDVQRLDTLVVVSCLHSGPLKLFSELVDFALELGLLLVNPEIQVRAIVQVMNKEWMNILERICFLLANKKTSVLLLFCTD